MPLIAKEELYHLHPTVPAMVSQDAYPDQSTRKAFIDLYRYRVPIGNAFIFRPGHTFSLYAVKLALRLGGASADDGGAYTDETEAANEATINDMQLAPAVPAAADAYYFGSEYPFNALTVKYSTAATAGTVAWEYRTTGAAWAALPGLTDGTGHWITAAGTHIVTWTMPTDWARYWGAEVEGKDLFWVRAVSSAASDVATGDQAWIHAATTVMDNKDRIRVEVREADELSKELLIDGAMYQQVTNFQDRELIYRLDINKEVVASDGKWIVVAVQAMSVIDVSSGYFDLTCDRQRQTMLK